MHQESEFLTQDRLAEIEKDTLGNGTNSNRKCQGCGYCLTQKDPAQAIKRRTQRWISTKTHLDTVLGASNANQARHNIVVKWFKNPQYAYMDSNTIFHYLWGHLNEEMAKKYGREEVAIWRNSYESPQTRCSKNNCLDMTSGVQINYVGVKHNMPFELSEYKAGFSNIKSNVLSAQYLDSKYAPLDISFKDADWQLVIIRSKQMDLSLKDSIMAFDNRFPIILKDEVGSSSINQELKYFPEVPKFLFYPGTPNQGSYIIASLNLIHNPFLVMSALTGKRLRKCYSDYSIHRLLWFRTGMRACSSCGGTSMQDLFSSQDIPYCETCYRKTVLLKLRNQ